MAHCRSVLIVLCLLLPRAVLAQAGVPYLAEPKAPPPEVQPVAPVAAPAVHDAAVVPKPSGRTPLADVRGRPFEHFQNLWQQRRQALAAKDPAQAQTVLDQLVREKLESGWPDIFVYGEALAHESRADIDAAHAVLIATQATQLAPHKPATHMALARAHWHAKSGLGQVVSAGWAAVKVAFGEPPLLRMRFGAFLLLVAAGLLAAGMLVVLASLWRHARSLFHDLLHFLPPGTLRLQAVLFGATILFLPVFFRVGIAFVAMFWAVLLSPYFVKNERAATAVVLVLVGLFSMGLPQITSHFAFAQSRSMEVYLSVRDASAEDAASRLKSRPNLGPEELYALGLRARFTGKTREAYDWLERALQMGATSEVYVTLGNMQYLDGNLEAAVQSFLSATQKAPENATAHFNLARAYYATAEHLAAGAAQRAASALDYNLVEEWSKEAKLRGRSYIVEPFVPTALLNVPLAYGPHHMQAVRDVFKRLSSRTQRVHFSIAAVIAAVLVALTGIRRRGKGLSKPCSRCGMLACMRCNPEMNDTTQCGQCYHAFVMKTGVVAQVRVQKEIEAHRWKARRQRLRQALAVLMCGTAQMARGATLLGFVLSATFVGALVLVLTGLGFLPELVTLDGGPSWVSLGAGGGVLFVTYIVGLVDGFREG